MSVADSSDGSAAVSAKCCEAGLPSSNRAQPGDIFQCPRCGRAWEHDCDEAEGCMWHEVDYDVTVCAECLHASCWHGEFMCEKARTANTTKRPASELRRRKVEHHDCFSLAAIDKVGESRPKLRPATPTTQGGGR